MKRVLDDETRLLRIFGGRVPTPAALCIHVNLHNRVYQG